MYVFANKIHRIHRIYTVPYSLDDAVMRLYPFFKKSGFCWVLLLLLRESHCVALPGLSLGGVDQVSLEFVSVLLSLPLKNYRHGPPHLAFSF